MQVEAPPLADEALAAYLARIGLRDAPAADAEGLALLTRAHRLAIPFENLDILLGRGISLDHHALFDKLVTRRRGGYCFEQNGLFGRVLMSLGFVARPLLARVWLMAGDEVPPRTHTLLLVTIDGIEWVADAGFGGAWTPPMPLAESEVVSEDGSAYRLARHDQHGWMLARRGDADAPWIDQYSFTTESAYPADLALANHWTATAPGTRFVTTPFVTLVLPAGQASLIGTDYSRRNGAQQVAATIESATAYRLRLQWVFGLTLEQAEIEALGLYPPV